jgi:hypothetical protein
MNVEPYIYRSGLRGVRIIVENAYSPWVLTLDQAVDLHDKLGHILWEEGAIQILKAEYSIGAEKVGTGALQIPESGV